MMDHFTQMRILDHKQRHRHCNRIIILLGFILKFCLLLDAWFRGMLFRFHLFFNEHVQICRSGFFWFVCRNALHFTAPKSEVIFQELVRKGELTVEQGRVLNEELKHNLREAIRENVTVNVLDMSEDIMSSVKDMDDEQLEALKQCIRDAEQARKAEEVSEAVDDGEKNDTEEPVGEDMD